MSSSPPSLSAESSDADGLLARQREGAKEYGGEIDDRSAAHNLISSVIWHIDLRRALTSPIRRAACAVSVAADRLLSDTLFLQAVRWKYWSTSAVCAN